MNDRELLQLAAKAAGISLLNWRDSWADYPCAAWRTTEYELWNPLEDDGDALRLAVKLKLAITVSKHHETHCEGINGEYAFTKHVNDANAATRRAIVMVAAEIGRAMP